MDVNERGRGVSGQDLSDSGPLGGASVGGRAHSVERGLSTIRRVEQRNENV
jgi:hypothetical protein